MPFSFLYNVAKDVANGVYTSNVIDLSLDDQEVESNLKRKPENQGGNSKRLRK